MTVTHVNPSEPPCYARGMKAATTETPVAPTEREQVKPPVRAILRSIRFLPSQHRMIEAKAKALGMHFSSFVKLSALKAAGLKEGDDERAAQEALDAIVR